MSVYGLKGKSHLNRAGKDNMKSKLNMGDHQIERVDEATKTGDSIPWGQAANGDLSCSYPAPHIAPQTLISQQTDFSTEYDLALRGDYTAIHGVCSGRYATKIAQLVTTGSRNISKAVFKLKKYGTPSGTVWAALYADSGSNTPAGNSLMNSNESYNCAEIGASFADFEFTFPKINVCPTSTSKIHIVLEGDYTAETANYIGVAEKATTATGMNYYAGTTWYNHDPMGLYYKAYYGDPSTNSTTQIHSNRTSGVHGVGSSTIESASGSQGKVDTHAALTATHGVSGAIVGTTDTQTLSNKTLGGDLNANSLYQVTNLQAPATSGEAIRQTTKITEANLETAVDHYSDNTQAHSDYLLNNADDVTSGNIEISKADPVVELTDTGDSKSVYLTRSDTSGECKLYSDGINKPGVAGTTGDGVDDSYTKALLHFDGTDASTTFVDESGKTWAAYGDAQIDTAQSAWVASGLFDGTGDYIDTPDHADFAVGSGNFTLGCRVKRNTTGSRMAMCGQSDSAVGAANAFVVFEIQADNTVRILLGNGGSWAIATSTGTLTDTTSFHQIDFVRYGNTGTIYIDGVADGTVNLTGITLNDSAYKFAIGRCGEYNGWYWNGWIDEFRFSKGIARWTANFTPPTNPYGYVAGADVTRNLYSMEDGVASAEGGKLYFGDKTNPDHSTYIRGNVKQIGEDLPATNEITTFDGTNIIHRKLVNASVDDAAAIAYSKLNLGTSIVNADVSASAAIEDTKLGTISTANKVNGGALVAASVLSSALKGYVYVPRALTGWDFTEVDSFGTTGSWQPDGLDLSGIVPAGAVSVHLIMTGVDDAAGSTFAIRTNATANAFNMQQIFTPASQADGSWFHFTIPIDSNRLVDYYATANMTYKRVSVAGWYI